MWPPRQSHLIKKGHNGKKEEENEEGSAGPARRPEAEGQDERTISTAELNMLPCVHPPPINLVICQGP